MFNEFINTGGASAGDPYANIQIDLNAVKVVTKPAKPFEDKTEEEKMKDAEKRDGIKSNLKTTKKDFDDAASKGKKGVRFGKSTTYQVNKDSDDSGIFNSDDMGDDKGSPRLRKKVIEEKDLSDGRDEKEKA